MSWALRWSSRSSRIVALDSGVSSGSRISKDSRQKVWTHLTEHRIRVPSRLSNVGGTLASSNASLPRRIRAPHRHFTAADVWVTRTSRSTGVVRPITLVFGTRQITLPVSPVHGFEFPTRSNDSLFNGRMQITLVRRFSILRFSRPGSHRPNDEFREDWRSSSSNPACRPHLESRNTQGKRRACTSKSRKSHCRTDAPRTGGYP